MQDLRMIIVRILQVTTAGGLWMLASAAAADPAFDPMQHWSGPTAIQPSRGGRDIMREAERGPSLTQRFGLPQISGPMQLDLPPALAPRNGGELALPPTVPPEMALRPRR
jgi:hypothetical protein